MGKGEIGVGGKIPSAYSLLFATRSTHKPHYPDSCKLRCRSPTTLPRYTSKSHQTYLQKDLSIGSSYICLTNQGEFQLDEYRRDGTALRLCIARKFPSIYSYDPHSSFQRDTLRDRLKGWMIYRAKHKVTCPDSVTRGYVG